nr:UvrD-helicase domain-containing protein [uncultured Pseudodesulfovibrio sp.]
MNISTAELDNTRDDHVDDEIEECLLADPPRSFFLFAGAGSGKTRSLKEALERLAVIKGDNFRLTGQHVGVITFTNKAVDEIKHRVRYNELFQISTIHSFAWSLIESLTRDIRTWLENALSKDIGELEAKESKGRAGTKASAERLVKIASKTKRLSSLPDIKKFTYNPNGDNTEKDSLNHSEVIKIASEFLHNKPLMREMFVSHFPILLIDESQDTHKELMAALLDIQEQMGERFAMGVIGDMMQRIYFQGQKDLNIKTIPSDWATPAKVMNHRSQERIVDFINLIRKAEDTQEQIPRSEKANGHVRLFVLPATTSNKLAAEDNIYHRMAEITHDEKWVGPKQDVKTLTLIHRMAAERLGFDEMWEPLDKIKKYTTSLRDGSLPSIRFFSRIILPLSQADKAGDPFGVMKVVRKESPLLDAKLLKDIGSKQDGQLKKVKQLTQKFLDLWSENDDPSFLQVLHKVVETGLFLVPDELTPFVQSSELPDDPKDKPSPETLAWRTVLGTSFSQIEMYDQYVNGTAPFDTHQGVKGLEFPRVCVIMDDSNTRWRQFSYEALFGVKESSTIEATRKLFYVTCSRAEESLALIAYTSNPDKVKSYATESGWFTEEEVLLL